MRTREAQAAARRGAKLLDKDDRTLNWHTRINTDTFDQEDFWECILGQLFGSYVLGAFALQETGTVPAEDRVHYGFSTGEYSKNSHANYARLTAAWKEEVQRRRTRGE